MSPYAWQCGHDWRAGILSRPLTGYVWLFSGVAIPGMCKLAIRTGYIDGALSWQRCRDNNRIFSSKHLLLFAFLRQYWQSLFYILESAELIRRFLNSDHRWIRIALPARFSMIVSGPSIVLHPTNRIIMVQYVTRRDRPITSVIRLLFKLGGIIRDLSRVSSLFHGAPNLKSGIAVPASCFCLMKNAM